MEISTWILANVATRLAFYLGLALVMAIPFIVMLAAPLGDDYRSHLRRTTIVAALLGFVSLIANFFIQVGAFTESGFFGMFDPDMINFIWQSPIGDSFVLRLVGFSVLSLALFSGIAVDHNTLPRWHCLLAAVGAVVILYSFLLVGHITDQSWLVRGLLFVHVLVAMIWMGSLYPLWKSCDYLETPLLKQLMTRFGEIASFAVPVLILMGGLMLWVLLPSLSALYQTPYGKLVSFKLFSVVLMLMLAARHKWFLVPNLESQGNVLKLKRSIQCEAVLGCMILVVTAYFSSSVGLH